VHAVVCAKVLDTADIVREAIYQESYEKSWKGHRYNPKNGVAFERTAVGRHLHRSSGRPSGHAGFNFGSGHNGERRRSAVKRNAGRAPQIVSQKFYGCSHLARGRQGLHERAKPHR
jgi:hypothetical protein